MSSIVVKLGNEESVQKVGSTLDLCSLGSHMTTYGIQELAKNFAMRIGKSDQNATSKCLNSLTRLPALYRTLCPLWNNINTRRAGPYLGSTRTAIAKEKLASMMR